MISSSSEELKEKKIDWKHHTRKETKTKKENSFENENENDTFDARMRTIWIYSFYYAFKQKLIEINLFLSLFSLFFSLFFLFNPFVSYYQQWSTIIHYLGVGLAVNLHIFFFVLVLSLHSDYIDHFFFFSYTESCSNNTQTSFLPFCSVKNHLMFYEDDDDIIDNEILKKSFNKKPMKRCLKQKWKMLKISFLQNLDIVSKKNTT